MSSFSLDFKDAEDFKAQIKSFAKMLGLDEELTQMELPFPKPEFQVYPASSLTKLQGIREPVPEKLVETLTKKRGRPPKAVVAVPATLLSEPVVPELQTETADSDKPEQTSEVSMEEAKAIGLEFMNKNGLPAAVAIFEKLGVEKFSQLKADQIPAFLAEIKNYKKD